MLSLSAVPHHYAGARPDELCLIHDGEKWTWAIFAARAEAWARWLASRGVGADDFVAFARPNGPDFFALVFGVYRLGATPAPLSPRLTAGELQEILQLMQPAVFVPADQECADLGATLPGEHPVAKSWKACTSGGSTGRPKVIVDGRPAAFDLSIPFVDLPSAGVISLPGPLYHNAPFSAAVLGLARGNTVVTMQRFDPEGFLSLVEAHRIMWAMMVPTMMHRIWRLGENIRQRYDLGSLQKVVHTAAPMPIWLKHAWIEWLGPERVWETYGATEGLMRTWIGGGEWLERPGSVGKAAGGSFVRVLRPDGQDCAAGETGEIYMLPQGGPGSTYHYIGAQSRRTADGWESVGDMGRLDEDGYLFLADRRDDLIISGGVNIYPAEVEAAVLLHPSVASCAVVGMPDEDLGQRVHVVVESSDPALDLAALRTFLADRLAKPKIPRSLDLRSGAVRDDAGKVRRTTLSSWNSN